MNKHDFLATIRGDYFRFLENGIKNMVYLEADKAFFPAGHNGPHFCLESPVRNSCHWLAAFSIGHRVFPDRGFDIVAQAIYRWLVEECMYFRNSGYVFRQKGDQDWCNGVIGYAWMIEALARANSIVPSGAAKQFALHLYAKHQFDEQVGAWHRFDPNTNKYSIDFTLDHQAWFAAAAADIGELAHAEAFLSACKAGAFRVRSSGRINHLFVTNATFKSLALRCAFAVRSYRDSKSVAELEIGYHHYTLLPFARLAQKLPNHQFFQCSAFIKAMTYLDENWFSRLEGNKFAFPYNAPGFELPIILASLEGNVRINWDQMLSIYEEQMRRVCDSGINICSRSNPDPLTLTSRIYELGLFLEQCLDESL